MLNLNFVTPKRHFLARNRVIKEREGKAQSHASVIFHLFVGKPPVNGFSPNFAYQEICWTWSFVQILVWKN